MLSKQLFKKFKRDKESKLSKQTGVGIMRKKAFLFLVVFILSVSALLIIQSSVEAYSKTLQIGKKKHHLEKNSRAKEKDLFPGPRYIALTFDDGPDSILTPQLLDLLESYNVPATFFVVGQRVRGNEAILRRMIQDGDEIGNHTWDHQNLTCLSSSKIKKEVLADQKIILACTNYEAKLFRPPYGACNVSSKKAVGMPFVLWTVDPKDWRDRNANIICKRVLKETKNRSIILLHDIHPTTLEAVKRFIPKLKEAGFIFVTVSELKNL